MKNLIILFISCLLTAAQIDLILVTDYCTAHYPDYTIEYVENPTYKTLTNRKGKILVEKIESISAGDHGYTPEGYYIAYNKKVPEGESVTSYIIYNPDTDYEDDVVAVVDNNEIR